MKFRRIQAHQHSHRSKQDAKEINVLPLEDVKKYSPKTKRDSYGAYPLRGNNKLGIPGPHGIPFFGSALELLSERDKFYTHINKWKKQYGHIFCLVIFREPIIFITDPEALGQIFIKDFHMFADRHFVGYGNLIKGVILKSLFFAEGSDWQRIRRIATPLFSGARIKQLLDHINLTAKLLGDNLEKCAKEGIKPQAKGIFAAYSLDFLVGTAFGIQLDALNNPEHDMHKATRKLLGINDFGTNMKMTLACTFPFMGKVLHHLGYGLFNDDIIQFFMSFAKKRIEERKKHPDSIKHADYLQFFINAEAEPSSNIEGARKLTPTEVAAQSLVFMIAGYESLSTSLQFLTYELGQNQDIEARVIAEIDQVVGTAEQPTYEHYKDLKYLDAVIQETLRKYPPLHIISRKTMVATDIKGFHIPANTGIFVPVRSLTLDPEFFEDPLRFDPERFLGEKKNDIDAATLMSFGLGPRQCVGQRLAMFVMKAALVSILRKMTVVDSSPKTLVIDDTTPMLIPQTPIKLHLQMRE